MAGVGKLNIGNEPLISVVMTVYNGVPHLKPAIDSILNQTYTNLEFIIIDDGSTDSTFETIQEIARGDRRLKFFRESRVGRARALNLALSKASGKYVAIQDADDLSAPERLQMELGFLEAHPEYGMVGGQYEVRDIVKNEVEITELPTEHELLCRALTKGQCFCHPSILFRKRILDQIGGYDVNKKFLLDRDIFIRVARVSKVANLQERLVTVLHHPNRFFFFGFSSRRREIHHNWMRMVAIWKLGFSKHNLLQPIFGLIFAFFPHRFRLSVPRPMRKIIRNIIYPDNLTTKKVISTKK